MTKIRDMKDEFDEEVEKELGYVSALFMSQECKGVEIIMPTEELKKVADRIGLYAFRLLQQELEKLEGEIDGKLTVYYRSKFSQDCSRNETEEEKNTEMLALSDVLSIIRQHKQG